MPTVPCPACHIHLAVLDPFDPASVSCPHCGKTITPPPVPPVLQLTADEQNRMDGWNRYMNSLRKGPPAAREQFPDRYQRLRNAVCSGETWRVKWELVDGADPNLAKPMMPYPLHDAAEGGHVEIVKLLLAVGANPGNLNSDRQTPEEVATGRGHAEVVAVLQQSVRTRMGILSILYPINFLLAGAFFPLPIAWLMMGVGRFDVASLGLMGIGYVLLWLFGRTKRFQERSRQIAFTLLLGGLCASAIMFLGVLIELRNLFVLPREQVQLTSVLIFEGASLLVVGLGYWQFKLTPGDGSYDERA
jgi:hypothetical protein